MWESSIITASNNIFPELAWYDNKKEFYDKRNIINSNLPLQMVLYCNLLYFPVWLIVVLYYMDAKYHELSEIYKFVTAAMFLMIFSFESVRLYLGYLGNLGEKIPQLASFWLLSTLLQFPLELFLVFDQNIKYRLNERIFNEVALLFLITEIIIGTIVLKKLADHYAKRFYMAQMYGIKNLTT